MPSCNLQFIGDISLDRYLSEPESRQKLQETSQWLSRQVPEADVRVVNWESPLEGDEGQHEMDKPIVGTNVEAARSFLNFRIDVASMANNHIFDFKGSGLRNTIQFLENNSVKTVGVGNDPARAYNPLNIQINELPLTFISYVGRDTNPPPEEPDMYVNILEPEKVLRTVRKLVKRERKIIANFHWGQEYDAYPSPRQRSFCREVIEAGAMVVVCHHSHRLQGHEQWLHGHIFYGLGNFMFGLDLGESWPLFTNPTAVAYCSINDDMVTNAGMIHFNQLAGQMTKPDPMKAYAMEKRLCRPLALSDGLYGKFWKLMNIYHLIYEKPVDAFQRRGTDALFKINRDHAKSLLKALFFWKSERPKGKDS